MENKRQNEELDRQLDTPAESNQDKHINFREKEEESSRTTRLRDNENKERKKEWEKGLDEGRDKLRKGED